MLNLLQIQIRLTMDILFMDCRIIIWTYNRFIFYDTYEYQNLLPDSLSSLWYVFDNNYGERYENSQSSPHCKEQLTGSIVRILGTEEYQYASYYYDYYHNLIQERKTTSGGNKKVNKIAF